MLKLFILGVILTFSPFLWGLSENAAFSMFIGILLMSMTLAFNSSRRFTRARRRAINELVR